MIGERIDSAADPVGQPPVHHDKAVVDGEHGLLELALRIHDVTELRQLVADRRDPLAMLFFRGAALMIEPQRLCEPQPAVPQVIAPYIGRAALDVQLHQAVLGFAFAVLCDIALNERHDAADDREDC